MIKIVLIILGLLYTLSPYDLLPDFIVGFGWLDDLAVIALIWRYLYPFRKKHSPGVDFNEKSKKSSEGRTRNANKQNGGWDTSDDPYAVLGIQRDASSDEIKEVYRRLVKQYHPDKVQHLGEEFRELAEKRFKEIQEAYLKIKPK